jgi:poly(hydroxyalkanoate) depolymerase family esterase
MFTRAVFLLVLSSIFSFEISFASSQNVAAPDSSWLQWRTEYRFFEPVRRYAWWAPSSDIKPRGLVVLLHGCQTSVDTLAQGTRILTEAVKRDLVVVLPQQSSFHQPLGCWNWYSPFHQRRGLGEPAWLAGVIQEMQRRFELPREQTLVAGMSAGGAMAATLAAIYPDLVARVAVHSGVAYSAASSSWEARVAMRRGPQIPIESAVEMGVRESGGSDLAVGHLIFHGEGDEVVAAENALALVEQALAFADWKDDRQVNGSVKREVLHTRELQDGSGASIFTHDSNVLRVSVPGLGHAWSGGDGAFPWHSDRGPRATALILEWAF